MTAATGAFAIPHQALLLICDGQRALIARNRGGALHVRLEVVETLAAPDNPRAALQGADRPGRLAMAGQARRSAVEATDRHQLAEVAFVRQAAEAFARMAARRPDTPLALVAPPTALATLRGRLDKLLAGRRFIQVHKDLTKHPVEEMERILSRAAPS